MSNADNPAFPVDGNYAYDAIQHGKQGLTKREMFAMAAMQGILANPANSNLDVMGVNTAGPLGFIAANFAAKEAVQYADELLKALEQ